MLTRRGFFSKTIGALAAALVAPAALKALPVAAVQELRWHDYDADRISMRWVKQYVIQPDQFPMRYDVYYAAECVLPNQVVRIARTHDSLFVLA